MLKKNLLNPAMNFILFICQPDLRNWELLSLWLGLFLRIEGAFQMFFLFRKTTNQQY